jgi:hypothetical protein
MRQSARRTRSLFIRYAVAEAIAFPGIRTDWPTFPYHEKHYRNTPKGDSRLVRLSPIRTEIRIRLQPQAPSPVLASGLGSTPSPQTQSDAAFWPPQMAHAGI